MLVHFLVAGLDEVLPLLAQMHCVLIEVLGHNVDFGGCLHFVGVDPGSGTGLVRLGVSTVLLDLREVAGAPEPGRDRLHFVLRAFADYLGAEERLPGLRIDLTDEIVLVWMEQDVLVVVVLQDSLRHPVPHVLGGLHRGSPVGECSRVPLPRGHLEGRDRSFLQVVGVALLACLLGESEIIVLRICRVRLLINGGSRLLHSIRRPELPAHVAPLAGVQLRPERALLVLDLRSGALQLVLAGESVLVEFLKALGADDIDLLHGSGAQAHRGRVPLVETAKDTLLPSYSLELFVIVDVLVINLLSPFAEACRLPLRLSLSPQLVALEGVRLVFVGCPPLLVDFGPEIIAVLKELLVQLLLALLDVLFLDLPEVDQGILGSDVGVSLHSPVPVCLQLRPEWEVTLQFLLLFALVLGHQARLLVLLDLRVLVEARANPLGPRDPGGRPLALLRLVSSSLCLARRLLGESLIRLVRTGALHVG